MNQHAGVTQLSPTIHTHKCPECGLWSHKSSYCVFVDQPLRCALHASNPVCQEDPTPTTPNPERPARASQ